MVAEGSRKAIFAVVLAAATHASAEVVRSNPSTAGFPTLSLNTPTSFAFPGTGGMTMTRASAVGSGARSPVRLVG